MISIRRHILLWLLPGFILLWIGAGGALYFSVKQRYEIELDAALRELWAAFPFGNPAGRSSLLSIEDYAKDDFGVYFQAWHEKGARLLKSENLGRFELPKIPPFNDTPVYFDTVLDNTEKVRALSVAADDGALGNIHIVLAKSRMAADASLLKNLYAIIGIGLIAGALFLGLLSHAIRSGLKPLNGVGFRVSNIDINTLGERFPEKPLPRELRPIVEGLNRLMDRLQESFLRERKFSANLAHELRTPVAALRSIAEIALKWPEQAEKSDYEDILKISRELQVTIENLLTLARLENSKDQPNFVESSMDQLIKSSWKPYEEQARQREIRFENSIKQNKLITTDPEIFNLILSNLFSNGVSYAPHGSCVTLNDDDANILIVKNAAPHLTESDLPKMFDRMWRHDKARTDSGHTGIGLSIAKSAAELLCMTLTASLEGEFVCFSLK